MPATKVIRTPRCIPKILYASPGDSRRSLQSHMGLREARDEFKCFLDLIRTVWTEYGVDCQVTYTLQDPALMDAVEEEVVRRLPHIAQNYEDAWPVTFYLKRALKSHGKDYPSKRVTTRREVTSPVQRQNYSFRPVSTANARTEQTHQRSQRHVFTRAMAHTASSVSSSSASTIVNAPALPSIFPSPPMSATTPITNPGISSPSFSVPCDAQYIRTLLSTFGLPAQDVERLALLFASMGIVDLVYLRVLARMHSRDGWLHELREKGTVTEIQMRVLREMLESIVRE